MQLPPLLIWRFSKNTHSLHTSDVLGETHDSALSPQKGQSLHSTQIPHMDQKSLETITGITGVSKSHGDRTRDSELEQGSRGSEKSGHLRSQTPQHSSKDGPHLINGLKSDNTPQVWRTPKVLQVDKSQASHPRQIAQASKKSHCPKNGCFPKVGGLLRQRRIKPFVNGNRRFWGITLPRDRTPSDQADGTPKSSRTRQTVLENHQGGHAKIF